MRALFHEEKALVWFFSYWLWALVAFNSVLFPTVTHPARCQTFYRGEKNYRIQFDLALIKLLQVGGGGGGIK